MKTGSFGFIQGTTIIKISITLAVALLALAILTKPKVFAADGEVNWDHYSKIETREGWNTWRKDYPDKKPDLRNGDFSSGKGFRDLVRYNLTNCDLRSAKMSGANLSGADLSGANLEGADLRGAYYSGATKFPEGFDPVAAGMSQG